MSVPAAHPEQAKKCGPDRRFLSPRRPQSKREKSPDVRFKESARDRLESRCPGQRGTLQIKPATRISCDPDWSGRDEESGLLPIRSEADKPPPGPHPEGRSGMGIAWLYCGYPIGSDSLPFKTQDAVMSWTILSYPASGCRAWSASVPSGAFFIFSSCASFWGGNPLCSVPRRQV